MSHDDRHEIAILEVAFGSAEATGEVLALLTRCDECLAMLARALEDATVLGGGARAARLNALLEETLVWRAVEADAGGPGPGVDAGAVVAAKRRGKS